MPTAPTISQREVLPAPADRLTNAEIGTGLAGRLPEAGAAFTPGRFNGYAAEPAAVFEAQAP
ncbi:hypothetical protein ACWEGE_32905 [Amycolatopsis sp. NPDC004747]